jgi:membrane protein required for beta-lactamase induction
MKMFEKGLEQQCHSKKQFMVQVVMDVAWQLLAHIYFFRSLLLFWLFYIFVFQLHMSLLYTVSHYFFLLLLLILVHDYCIYNAQIYKHIFPLEDFSNNNRKKRAIFANNFYYTALFAFLFHDCFVYVFYYFIFKCMKKN